MTSKSDLACCAPASAHEAHISISASTNLALCIVVEFSDSSQTKVGSITVQTMLAFLLAIIWTSLNWTFKVVGIYVFDAWRTYGHYVCLSTAPKWACGKINSRRLNGVSCPSNKEIKRNMLFKYSKWFLLFLHGMWRRLDRGSPPSTCFLKQNTVTSHIIFSLLVNQWSVIVVRWPQYYCCIFLVPMHPWVSTRVVWYLPYHTSFGSCRTVVGFIIHTTKY